MCCTNGYFGYGVYNPLKKYPIYNDYFFYKIREIHRQKGSIMMENGFPRIWNKKFLFDSSIRGHNRRKNNENFF